MSPGWGLEKESGRHSLNQAKSAAKEHLSLMFHRKGKRGEEDGTGEEFLCIQSARRR